MEFQTCDELAYEKLPAKTIHTVVKSVYSEALGISNEDINPDLSFVSLGGMYCFVSNTQHTCEDSETDITRR